MEVVGRASQLPRNIEERTCLFSQSDDATSAASTANSNVVNSPHQITKTSVEPYVYGDSMLAASRGLSLSRLCAVILHVTDPWITGDKDVVQYPPSGYAVPWFLVNEHQILLERRFIALICFKISCTTSHALHVVFVSAILGSYSNLASTTQCANCTCSSSSGLKLKLTMH